MGVLVLDYYVELLDGLHSAFYEGLQRGTCLDACFDAVVPLGHGSLERVDIALEFHQEVGSFWTVSEAEGLSPRY